MCFGKVLCQNEIELKAEDNTLARHSDGKAESNASQKVFAGHSEGKAEMNA
ncbi:hypothetical protein MKX67_06220 [Cytobacillus sp. FSL W7-1323]|uniref:hypothetical protein n=1 Tax=unclassified Cytobacillus TaxID=2675268 RepID=UPI0030F5F0A1